MSARKASIRPASSVGWILLTAFGAVCVAAALASVPTALAEPEGLFGEAFQQVALLTIAIAFPVGALSLIAAWDIRARQRADATVAKGEGER